MLFLQLSVLLFAVVLCKGCNTPTPNDSGDVCDENATGEDVVNAVISLIESTNIFDCDHFFMRRLAYVQTNDGRNMKKSSYGIWALKERHILRIINSTHPHLRYVGQLIEEIFHINVSIIDTLQLQKPLVCGVMTRFYFLVLNVTENKTIPMTISEQANLWYHKKFNKRNQDQQYFIERVTELEEHEVCPVKSDIMFVLDVSHSVKIDTHFNRMKEFQYSFVERLTIGRNHSQVGTIVFNKTAKILFNLNTYNDKQKLLSAIHNTNREKYGGTNIERALCSLRYAFNEENGGRQQNSGVFRIAIIITDGKPYSRDSPCEWDSISEAADDVKEYLSPILIYVIGITKKANDTLLQLISTSINNCYSYLHIMDNGALLQEEHFNQVCKKASVSMDNDELYYGARRKLGENETFRYNRRYSMQVEIKICISKGRVELYISTAIPNPNSALYDWYLELESSQNNDSEICDSVIINPDNSTRYISRSHRLRQLPPTADHEYGQTVFFSVVGRAAQNEFVVLPDDAVVMNNGQNKSDQAVDPTHIISNKTDEDPVKKENIVLEATSSSAVLLIIIICCLIIIITCAVRHHQKKKSKKTEKGDEYHLLTDTNDSFDVETIEF